MQKLLELRQKIRTVRNIRTITRTLATVSAAKLSRTRRRAAGLREYARRMGEILGSQQDYLDRKGAALGTISPLWRAGESVKKIALLAITADRGMCGNYNLAACRLALEFWEKRKKAGQSVKFLVKGRKGEKYFRKRGAEILRSEGWRREGVRPEEVEKWLAALLRLFSEGGVDEVHAVYTRFHSPVRRVPQVRRLLPVTLDRAAGEGEEIDKWYYEPSFGEIFDELLAIYLRVQLYDVLLESYASEHGARMITMEEAAERADKTLRDCRVRYNRLRREAITTDLLGVLFASRVVEEMKNTPGRLA